MNLSGTGGKGVTLGSEARVKNEGQGVVHSSKRKRHLVYILDALARLSNNTLPQDYSR